MILVAPSEPGQLHTLGQSSAVPEQYGADVLIITDQGNLVGIQRKTFPDDYLSSRNDGRLATSLTKLLQCDVRLLLLEGRPTWSSSGALISRGNERRDSNFMRSHLRSQLFTASIEYGITPHWTDDLLDTADFVRDLTRWTSKDRHESLTSRPGPQLRPLQRKFSERDLAVHILQGFDGIGPELAGRLYDHFGSVPLEWAVSPTELAEVPGMGPGRVSRAMRLVRGHHEHAESN